MKSLGDQNYCEGLVKAMRERLPEGVNLAHHLMDLLCLGKESVYRRLRGEVPFTFNEVVYLARHFNISLDNIMGDKVSNGAMFNLQLISTDDEFANYCEIQNYYANIFAYVAKDEGSEFTMACNSLPASFYSSYQYLTKYRLCRWLYHNEKLSVPTSLEAIEVPRKLIEVQDNLSLSVQGIADVSFIWDANVLKTFIREIDYFRALRLLSAEDVRRLKEELLHLLDELEKLTVRGYNPAGNKVSVYLSNIDFESSYGYARREGFQICFFRIHLLNSFDSQQTKICDAQRSWIKALRRHSTLISQSGEVERIRFFSEHRALVDGIETK